MMPLEMSAVQTNDVARDACSGTQTNGAGLQAAPLLLATVCFSCVLCLSVPAFATAVCCVCRSQRLLQLCAVFVCPCVCYSSVLCLSVPAFATTVCCVCRSGPCVCYSCVLCLSVPAFAICVCFSAIAYRERYIGDIRSWSLCVLESVAHT